MYRVGHFAQEEEALCVLREKGHQEGPVEYHNLGDPSKKGINFDACSGRCFCAIFSHIQHSFVNHL